MKFFVLAVFSLFASVVSAFHIVTPPGITSCGPLTVEYDTTTGEPPFTLSFHTGGSADGPVVAAFTNVTGTSFTWSAVTIPAGANVVILLADSGGRGSATSPITVSAGSSDVCLNNPTSIPSLPSVTSTSPPTSTFPGESSMSSSISTSLTTTTTTLSSSSSSSMSSSSSTSSSSGVSSSVSSLSSIISSASSQLSSLTATSSPRPSATGGLSTSGGVINTANAFGVGVIFAIAGAFLA